MATSCSPSFYSPSPSPSSSSSSPRSVLHHRAERVVTSLQISLLEAATYANENAVALALHSGADVNACDPSGRSIMTCAIGGERYGKLIISLSSLSHLPVWSSHSIELQVGGSRRVGRVVFALEAP